uniref:Signal recognition particle 19 kDa protein-like n=1 Tax=Dermatophagoides pteronyssinus TaxID=6956 RepID=A0A6P6XN25_DERPT|nr:signal recognition particle 19 kDa protein-like [Dermatophagoides pteronyssinus]
MARRPKQQQQQQQQQQQINPQQPLASAANVQLQQQQHQQMMMQALKSNVPNLDPNETKKWHTIYPQYINSNLTVDRGRRLGRSKCIADPLAEEIFNVLAANSQQFQVQLNMYKCYCREMDKENIRLRGYVKYRIINDNDQQQFKNKRQVLKYVASMIPKLKSRQNPQKSQQQQQQSSGGGGGGGSGGGGQQSEQSQQQPQQQQQQGGKKKNRRK